MKQVGPGWEEAQAQLVLVTKQGNNRAVDQHYAHFSQSYDIRFIWLAHVNQFLDAASVCSEWYILLQ